jgi:WD40 repeat protein
MSKVEIHSLSGRWEPTCLSDDWKEDWAVQPGLRAVRVAISPDGRRMLTLNVFGGGTLREFNGKTPIWHVPLGPSADSEIAFVNAGGPSLIAFETAPVRLGFGNNRGTTYREMENGSLVPAPMSRAAPRDKLLFDRQGRECAAIRGDGRLELWVDGQCVWEIEPTGPLWGASAFSADGKRLAVCRADGSIHVWSVADRGSEMTFVGDARPILQIAFTPDGRTLAGTADLRTIKFWNAATGRELLTLDTGLSSMRKFAFSPAGNALAACGKGIADGEGEIVVWLSRVGHAESDISAGPSQR